MIDELRSALESATLEAFRRSAERHRDERIYCAALYTSNGYEYVCDTISTFEGLNLVAKEYLSRRPLSTLEEEMRKLKWSPCDSPYHLENEHLFVESTRLLDEIWLSARQDTEHDSDRAFREIHVVFVEVLRKVRASGIFNSSCLVTLLAGDQSNEARVVNSEEVNDSVVCRAFEAELDLDADRLAKLRAARWPSDNYYEP